MNPGRLPSLRGLRTFCVAARHESFRLTAETLSVTPSAVSHQIKTLEDELNQALFTRTARSLELTHVGRRLYNELAPVMEELGDIMGRYQASHDQRHLRVSAQPFFASEMFVPELEDFTSSHPNLEIFVDTSDESSESHPANMDASIRLFSEPPTKLRADRLFPLKLVPACSPAFLERFSSEDEKLRQSFPVILHTTRPQAWARWQKQSGIKLQDPSGTLMVDSMIAVARAAERGLGAALVPMPLSENWFKYGALVRLFDETVEMPEAFYFVTDPADGDMPEVDALRAWVVRRFSNL